MKPIVKQISKEEASSLLNPYHYLTKESRGFRSGYNYGAFIHGWRRHGEWNGWRHGNDDLLAVCIFHNPSVPELVKGCFGLERKEQKGIFELGRLVKHPDASIILSQFVATAIRQLREVTEVKAILSYADSRYHTGYIYQALNFKYYGLTAQRSDFWFEQPDGTYIKHSRGKVKGFKGVWKERPRKHRYLMVYDKELITKWETEPYPKQDNIEYKRRETNGTIT